jgi:hypothetical protein
MVYLLFFLLLAGSLLAAENYRAGLTRAKAENKYVAIYFFSRY